MTEGCLRILLVSRDEDVYRLISGLLLQLGDHLSLEWEGDYRSGLQTISAKGHDVYLLDYRLGDQTGLQLLREAVSAGISAPFIIMTETHARDVDEAAIKAGAADYLIKTELNAFLLDRSIRYAFERKRVEEALRRSEESLARAQRIARLGNWDWNVQTNEMFWSDETYRILGLYPRETPAAYETFLRAVHPEDRGLVNRSVNEAIYMQKELSIEHRILLPYGGERIVHQQGEVTLDAEGAPLRMVGTLQDVTERRRVEDALHQMEEKFSKAFQASPDWIAMSSASDGRYLEVNDAFLSLTGYTREEVIGKTSIELGIWADPPERLRMLKLLDEHGLVRNLEVRFRMRSGDIRCMLWSADVIDFKGEACLIAVARDVTEQREMEDELVRSQAALFKKHEELTKLFRLVEAGKKEWEMTMDHMGNMVILADREGRIRRCNKTFRDFAGLSYNQIIGKNWVELLHDCHLMTGTIYLESMELYHEPTERWFVLNTYPFSDKEMPEVQGTVITVHDATELKRYSIQLQRLNQEEPGIASSEAGNRIFTGE
ncbi:PAS domain S-box protein [Geobacter sp. DSM 9736]|uniref:PAS domain S-box protein n=1 Tax=Geobacter sp. DSM 9736 TaxID=1277350 RepID=UPI000B50BEA1|nr:PAS domain S-box protein [Geobacter sp. DSM 9736]SNB47425.1 PAS domain S-box-containing protein [Geobacter sp. DSM 9736]